MVHFTKGELEIMRILWKKGDLKPADIQAQFPRKITNSSLRSYLAILVEKGHIVRRKVGKAFFYRAKTRRESTFRGMIRDLTRICFDGSIEAMLCHLIRTQRLSEEDLMELKRIAEEDPQPRESKSEGDEP